MHLDNRLSRRMITTPASKKQIPAIFTASLFFAAIALPVMASTTSIRYFRLGEADYTTAGAASTNSLDSSRAPGRAKLTVFGSPLYSADVANANSTLSLVFDGSQYATTTPANIFTTNFGVEAWVKPSSTAGNGNRFIVYSGNPGGSGWGIIQEGVAGQYQALFGGVAFLGQGDVTVGQWTHLAFVCTDSNTTFYVNGVPSGDPVAQLPSASSTTITIGAQDNDPTMNRFQGNIDEVRVFTFAPGAFVPTDLLFTARPLAVALQRQADQSTLTWPEVFPDFGLQTATDPTGTNGWTTLYQPSLVYDQFSITQTNDDGQRFYRLANPAGTNLLPALPAGQYIVLNDVDADSTNNITDPGNAIENSIFGSDETILDASSFIDLSNPNGTVDDLNFHWVITYPGLTGIYSDQGITGYYSPILDIMPNSLADGAANNNNAPTFTLTVTSKKDPSLVTTIQITAQVETSKMTLAIYSSCLGQTQACAQCPCTISNGLPTTEPH